MSEVPASMQALVNFAPEPGSVELREVHVPEIGDEDVLLQVHAVGICGSDVHQWQATHSWPVNYPCVLGHEFTGVVARAGRDVRRFREGDRVTSETAAVIDPDSPLTRQGQYQLDPSRKGFGYGVHGAMAKYVRVPQRCLHHVPPELPFEQAALTEPCCVAFNAVCMQTPILPGDDVLVLGPGPIGILCGVMARLAGAGHVVISGLASDAHRFQVAEKMGLHTVLAEDALSYVHALGDGLGVHVVVDAAGVSATLKTAMEAVRPGGRITKVGWGRGALQFTIDPIVQKAVTLQGSFSHNWSVWERVLALLGSGQLDVEPLIDRIAPLEEWEDAFTRMHECDYVKAVLRP